MNDIFLNIIAFIIALGFLIFAHESGHFFFAKLFRVRVLVFSFGFGKRLFGFRKGDTDYRVSLVPLGGYVRMAGDNPEENVPGNPDEFLSKPKWQRFLILFAGPMMNLLIAIFFVAGFAMIGSEQVIMKPVIAEVKPDSPASRAGLAAGDVIVRIKGETVNDFDDVRLLVSMNAGTPMAVVYKRDGVEHTTTLTPIQTEGDYGPIGFAGITPGIEPVIGRVEPGTPAAAAGLRSGDRIVAANGHPVRGFDSFATISRNAIKKPITVDVLRGGQKVTVPLAPTADENYTVLRGIIPPTKVLKLSLLPALQFSVKENWRILRFSFSAIGRLFRPEGSVKELSGPVNIARIVGQAMRHGWLEFLGVVAMISLQLGIMNLLPIPILDGGHIMVLLIEGIARRDLSLRVKERIQQVGFAALAMLMLVVLYNDVISNLLRFRRG